MGVYEDITFAAGVDPLMLFLAIARLHDVSELWFSAGGRFRAVVADRETAQKMDDFLDVFGCHYGGEFTFRHPTVH